VIDVPMQDWPALRCYSFNWSTRSTLIGIYG